jgi:hypothetical protein
MVYCTPLNSKIAATLHNLQNDLHQNIHVVKRTINIYHVQFYFIPICYSDKKINFI